MSNTVIFMNAAVTLPCGEWQKTHEFTGEVRIAKAGEDVLDVCGIVIRYANGSKGVLPILRQKVFMWKPPEYARGTGWTVEPVQHVMCDGWIIRTPQMEMLLVGGCGNINPVLAAAGWTIPPERKVYVC